MSKYKDGDVVKVKVGGVEYDTVIENGVQRFRRNKLLCWLLDDTKRIDLNQMAADYHSAKSPFTQREYAEFNMALGYSVCGFADLSSFQDMEIENPAWDKEE